MLHDRLIDHFVALDGVLLELALSLSQAITANFLLPIDTLQAKSAVLRFELRECSIVCDIIGFIRESYELSASCRQLLSVYYLSHTCSLRWHVLNVRHLIMSSLDIHFGLGLLGDGSCLLDSLRSRGSSVVCLLGLGCPSEGARGLERIGLEIGGLVAQNSTVLRL